MSEFPELMTGPQAAKAIGIGTLALAKWRMDGKGPRYIRLGGPMGRTRYRRQDVEAWLEAHSASSTSDEAVRGEKQ